ncbi:MAG: hypothetical protein HDQ98_16700 [Lachnospiraceae bacterium]|nr:hypothetical protein [Lachnospiraceae bacterium]
MSVLFSGSSPVGSVIILLAMVVCA